MNKKLIKSYAGKMSKERGVRVSAEEAEAEIVRVIQSVARVLAPAYRFGYHSIQDIQQEAAFEALKVLDQGKYDIARPLENFLYTHMHHRLYNFMRKHYMRQESPCKCCDPFNPPALPCQKWLDWSNRNSVKQNLMRPLDMSNINDETERNMRDNSEIVDNTVGSELRRLLDMEIPVELRRDYLQMLEGKVIPKARREKVRECVLSLVKERGYLDNDATQEDDG